MSIEPGALRGAGVSLLAVAAIAAAPAERMPDFELPDSAGNLHDAAELRGRPTVIVVTAPTMGNADAQRAWSDALDELIRARGVRVVFLQDLEPSWFEETARERIAEEADPGQEPIVLIDEDGSVRERFGVEAGSTVALLYDDAGRLLHVDRGRPDDDAAKRIRDALGSR